MALVIPTAGPAWAASSGGDRIDLPAGLVFPSNNSAVFDSAAPLAATGEMVVDAQGHFRNWFSDFPQFEASVAKGFKSVGFGLGGRINTFNDVLLAGGVGVGIEAVQLGVQADLAVAPAVAFSTDVGLRFGDPKRVAGGIIFYDVLGLDFTHFGLGLGVRAGAFVIEPDLQIYRDYGAFSFNTVTGSIGALLIGSDQLQIKFGTRFGIIPQLSLETSGLELGIAYWFSDGFALQAVVNHPQAPFMAGVKFKL